MADRKRTPDILGSLLGGAEEEASQKPAGKNTIKTEHHNDIMPVNHKDGTPADKPTIKPVRKKPEPQPAPEPGEAPEVKVKATYYLSGEIMDSLESVWIELRRLTPKSLRGQISKSLIVEVALEKALYEFNKKGKNSPLAKEVIKGRSSTS